MEGHMGSVVVGLDGLGYLPIEGEGFVQIARHERLENIAIKPLCRRARLQVEGVEAVESALRANGEAPTFRRVRVGVWQVSEVGGQGWFAMHGDSMRGFASQRRAGGQGQKRQKGSDEEANRSFFHAGRLKKCGCGVIVA